MSFKNQTLLSNKFAGYTSLLKVFAFVFLVTSTFSCRSKFNVKFSKGANDDANSSDEQPINITSNENDGSVTVEPGTFTKPVWITFSPASELSLSDAVHLKTLSLTTRDAPEGGGNLVMAEEAMKDLVFKIYLNLSDASRIDASGIQVVVKAGEGTSSEKEVTLGGEALTIDVEPTRLVVKFKLRETNATFTLVNASAPEITSFGFANEASDGFISAADTQSNLPLAVLNVANATGAASEYSAEYSIEGAVAVCNATAAYDLSTIPAISTISLDGGYKLCARVKNQFGNITYGDSGMVIRKTSIPEFTSLIWQNEASDGYITEVEKSGTSGLVVLSGINFDSDDFAVVATGTSCNASVTYSFPDPPLATDIAVDGPWKVCVRLSDFAGNPVAYGAPGSSITRDTLAPVFTSLNLANEASDGYVNAAEISSTSPIASLVATGQTATSYSAILDDTTPVSCGSQVYGNTEIPNIDTIPASDKAYAVCVRLTDDAGNLTYGKSQQVVRIATLPVFTSLARVLDAADGYINNSENSATNDLVGTLVATGYDAASFKLVTAATICNDSLSYDVIPKSNSADFGADGSYKVCARLTIYGQNAVYGASSHLILDRTIPVFSGLTDIISLTNRTEAMLFWAPATDTQTSSGDIVYDICASATPGSCTSTFTADQMTGPELWNYKVTGLNPGSDYEFIVRARDQAGNRDTNVVIKRNAALGDVISILSGSAHSCALLSSGAVQCWGKNANGQLGDGTTTDRSTPVAVNGITSATSLALGDVHSCALLSSGAVQCWGYNGYGRLGDGTTAQSTIPVAVIGISSASSIALGNYHSCALLSSGSLQCWGYNGHGQLGDGTTTQSITPVGVSGISTATALALGSYHSCALLDTGLIHCWGSNSSGQLGDGTLINKLTPVPVSGISTATSLAMGQVHSCALLNTGSVQCWGYNINGQLGDGTTINKSTPTAVLGISSASGLTLRAFHSCALLSTGSLQCWGNNSGGQLGDGTTTNRTTPVTASGITTATSLAMGDAHTCARLSSGSVQCWGSNISGQLGDGTTINRATPVVVSGIPSATSLAMGGAHSCALLNTGSVQCWGRNNYGQLGDGTTITRLSPVAVSSITSATSIALGESHSCALLGTGAVHCWGNNEDGQLGDGTTITRLSPVAVSSITSATLIALGEAHSCALLAAGSVRCWGNGDYGQLGDGMQNQSSFPLVVSGISTATALAMGGQHSCALLNNGTVRCWGKNDEGQLGDGTDSDADSPVSVSGISSATFISVGETHSCALLSDGSIRCWGYNSNGELGDGNTSGRLTPVAVVGISTATSIAMGTSHSCALLSSGAVKCWGANSSGQLGDGTKTKRITPVDVPGLSTVLSIATYSNHTCVNLTDQTWRCWGNDSSGQLGYGRPNQLVPGAFVLLGQ